MGKRSWSYQVEAAGEQGPWAVREAAGEGTDFLFDCREAAEELAALLQRHQASPVHLQELTRDFLYQRYLLAD